MSTDPLSELDRITDEVTVVGIDPSLTSTGVVAVSVSRTGQTLVATERVRTKATGHVRLDYLVQTVVGMAMDADLVVIEGPAYGSARMSSASGQHERAGLWWLLTHELWEQGQHVAVCPPNIRALYATGKGNADKDSVLLATARRYPGVAITGNDEADALVMAALGARHLGLPIPSENDLSARHLDALNRVEWPLYPTPREVAS